VWNLASLRGRYLAVTAAVGLFITAAAWITDHYVAHVEWRRTQSLHDRNIAARQGRLLRNAVLQAEQSVNGYMYSPAPQRRHQADAAIDNAMTRARRLATLPTTSSASRTDLRAIETLLPKLRDQLHRLMAVRADRAHYYPALETVSHTSFPAYRTFLGASDAALKAVSDRPPLRERLLRVRIAWLQMIGDFRLYLAARLGALSPNGGTIPAGRVAREYARLVSQLQNLSALGDEGALPLEVEGSVDRMRAAARQWHGGFRAIETLPGDGSWRSDVYLLENAIDPELDTLWRHLNGLEVALESTSARDVTVLTGAANRITRLLWGLTLGGLALVLLAYLYFHRQVLAPVSAISRALHAEARGDAEVPLPRVNTVETRGLVEAFSAMRRQVQERQGALEYQALHDALTGLPNRVLLKDRLQQALRRARRNDEPLVLMIMDLNRFKEINDTLGHQVGDALLQQVGQRLRATVREADTVARLGGDEFGILLPDSGQADGSAVAMKMLRALEEQPFPIGGRSLHVGASIGLATFPNHADDAQALSRRADVAMYVAKREKRGLAIYHPGQDSDNLRRLSLVAELREALEQGMLELHYQPQLGLRQHAVTGVEGLARWRHGQRGFIPPEEFITLAEQSGLIRQLSRQVLEMAVRQRASWNRAGIDLGVIGINLSVYDLQDPGFYREVAQVIEAAHVDPSGLMFEITESAMMVDPARALKTVSELHALGTHFAIDDFGTGYSSLSYLKRLPVETLKIDRSFVQEMARDDNDSVIVRSTVDLAHNLGLEVVAEGVENGQTLELLGELNCDTAQGYHIGRPVPAVDLERWYLQRAANDQLPPLPQSVG